MINLAEHNKLCSALQAEIDRLDTICHGLKLAHFNELYIELHGIVIVMQDYLDRLDANVGQGIHNEYVETRKQVSETLNSLLELCENKEEK